MDALLGAMRVFARAKIAARHKVLLAVRVEKKDTTLGELPLCSKAEHARVPGDGKARVKVKKLKACDSCGAWIEALAIDHISGKSGELSVSQPLLSLLSPASPSPAAHPS